MSVRIEHVASARGRRRFLALPRRIYAGDPHRPAPLAVLARQQLDPRRNAFWRHADGALFLAWRNGAVAGRICAHIDHAFAAHWNDPVGMFGFFECEHNRETACALFDAAAVSQ